MLWSTPPINLSTVSSELCLKGMSSTVPTGVKQQHPIFVKLPIVQCKSFRSNMTNLGYIYFCHVSSLYWSRSDILLSPGRFSTDEGQCWGVYNFTDDPIYFTGLASEPGARSMNVSIWGYKDSYFTQNWVSITIDFMDHLTRTCKWHHEKEILLV